MNCFYCGNEVDNRIKVCPYCGANVHVYRRIMATSNVCYNEGLAKARVRDLSGAARMLDRALKMNKHNTDARNLLGLVYYEMGEMVLALREWVISQNLQPENNPATEYIEELQKSREFFERTNQSIRKYNMALEYCRNGSYDLAKIQLKRVLQDNPKLVSGYQLLALLYIREKDYTAARSMLKKARAIDNQNTTTIRYLREIKVALKKQGSKGRNRRNLIAMEQEDNSEYGIRPRFIEAVESFSNELVNIVVGIIIGVLFCVFLLIPTIQQEARQDAANQLADANEEVMTTTTGTATLERRIEELEEQLEAYTSKGDISTSYELLMLAKSSLESEDYDSALEAMKWINPDIIGDNGKTEYNNLKSVLTDHYKEEYAALVDAGLVTQEEADAMVEELFGTAETSDGNDESTEADGISEAAGNGTGSGETTDDAETENADEAAGNNTGTGQ